MSVTLTFILAAVEEPFNIPQTVTIEPSSPATIYFTINGTTPTQSSSVYINPIALPVGPETVTLSAFGIDNTQVAGPILTQVFVTPVQPAADQTRIDRARLVGQEGFVLQRDGTNPEYVTGYDANGNAATYMNFEPDLIYMDTIHSDRGGEGSEGGYDGVAEGTKIYVGTPDAYEGTDFKVYDAWEGPDHQIHHEVSYEESERYNAFVPFSTTEEAAFFDPQAAFILIDTRKSNELNPILRGFMCLDNIYTEFGGKRLVSTASVADDASYVSGGFVMRHYNRSNNTMCSYYYDHNNCHWIKNIQALPPGAPAMPQNGIGIANNAKFPLVFQWIYKGRQSGLV